MNIFEIYITAVASVCAYKLILSRKYNNNNGGRATSIDEPIPKINEVVIVTVIHHTSNPVEQRNETEELRPIINWKTIPPRILVEEVLHWGKKKIQPVDDRKILPKVIFNNSNNVSVLGKYYFRTKTIEIYYRNHTNLNTLIETILHEYIHHLQLRYLKDDKKCDRLSRRIGYYNNPFEVEARTLAKKYRDQCIRDLRIQ